MSLDRVGSWSRDKLDILSAYLHAYARIMAAQKQPGRSREGRERRPWLRAFHYIDAFAGPGIAEFSNRGQVAEYLKGSPVRAIACQPRFDHLWFVDKNPRRAAALKMLVAQEDAEGRATILVGDCNPLIRDIVANLGLNERALAFLDPYGLQAEWETVSALGHSRKVDVFINFSLMGVMRNLQRRSSPTESFRARLKQAMMDDAWVDHIYVRQGAFFDEAVTVRHEMAAETLAQRYATDLRRVFSHVGKPAVMRNSRGGPVYALVFASHRPNAVRIMNEIIERRVG